jgi:hypothetical protein
MGSSLVKKLISGKIAISIISKINLEKMKPSQTKEMCLLPLLKR